MVGYFDSVDEDVGGGSRWVMMGGGGRGKRPFQKEN